MVSLATVYLSSYDRTVRDNSTMDQVTGRKSQVFNYELLSRQDVLHTYTLITMYAVCEQY